MQRMIPAMAYLHFRLTSMRAYLLGTLRNLRRAFSRLVIILSHKTIELRSYHSSERLTRHIYPGNHYMRGGFVAGNNRNEDLLGIPIEDGCEISVDIESKTSKVTLGCAIVIMVGSIATAHPFFSFSKLILPLQYFDAGLHTQSIFFDVEIATDGGVSLNVA